METIKLNLERYQSGRLPWENVIACLPGKIKTVKGGEDDDDIYVDECNKRIYFVACELGAACEAVPTLEQVIDGRYESREDLLLFDAMYHGVHLLDYDIYLIAAAEYEGDEPWYDDPGGDNATTLWQESNKVNGNTTFSYCVLSYFDRDYYLSKLNEKNGTAVDNMGKLDLMMKYVFQRTGIDLDCHGPMLLVYQDECRFEGLLASVNWFNDGKPTGIKDDKEFLEMWDGFNPSLLPDDSEEAIALIRTGVAMWDIDAKVEVDDKFKATYCIDGAKDYVPFPSGKYLHIQFIATFGERYKGNLAFDLIHDRSEYRSHWEMTPPDPLSFDISEPQFIVTEGFPMEQVLGRRYQVPTDSNDYITVVLYHNRKEVFRKSFQIKRLCA